MGIITVAMSELMEEKQDDYHRQIHFGCQMNYYYQYKTQHLPVLETNLNSAQLDTPSEDIS
jgi:hypothetical protein